MRFPCSSSSKEHPFAICWTTDILVICRRKCDWNTPPYAFISIHEYECIIQNNEMLVRCKRHQRIPFVPSSMSPHTHGRLTSLRRIFSPHQMNCDLVLSQVVESGQSWSDHSFKDKSSSSCLVVYLNRQLVCGLYPCKSRPHLTS
jgi:hypothetical protein